MHAAAFAGLPPLQLALSMGLPSHTDTHFTSLNFAGPQSSRQSSNADAYQ